MKIKEIAEKLHISPRAIRFYEEKGLLAPVKDRSGYRSFDEADVERLQIVIALREAGMPLEYIRKSLAVISAGDCGRLRRDLEIQRSAMASKWIELKQMIETADRMLALMDHRESVPVDELYRIAGQSRTMREQRSDWHDRWNYDRLASTHDMRVENESGEYSDYAEALDLVASWISALPTEEGLDLGTGTGNLAGRLLLQGVRMAGVDQSEQMLERCHAKFPQMETRIGNMLAVPYTEGRFDFIVSSFALHHLSGGQIRLAMEEMRRVLKPRGRICIADLLFPDERTKESYAENFPEYGEYALLPELTEWLAQRDYIVKTYAMNELLHIVYAVPIR